MIGIILCWLGYHKWGKLRLGNTRYTMEKCKRPGCYANRITWRIGEVYEGKRDA